MPGVSRQEAEALFAPLALQSHIGLAVSGGPDSLALMLLVAQWAKGRAGPAVTVYTVDHGLRPEAADEAAMVAREAARLGLACRVLRWSGRKPATGVQAAARRARYRLIGEAMAADGAEILVTAHHLNDQAETVLMRLAHGSGIDGLRGMDAVSTVEGCEIFRPLLGVAPEDLRIVVAKAGLAPALDPSNDDSAYERVRWRQALPQLAALGITPQRLGAMARRMDFAGQLIAEGTESAWPALVEWTGHLRAVLPQGRFATLNPLVGATLLGEVLVVVSGDRRPPSLGALEQMQAELQSLAPMKKRTLHGCTVQSDGTRIRIAREPGRSAARKARDKATSG